ncbi:MAG TPA: ATP-dependent helicase [Solirubrobacteraceae bacterium]|nr:ATP-dependent helicase [Solirubrobacteraceae bacterium]
MFVDQLTATIPGLETAGAVRKTTVPATGSLSWLADLNPDQLAAATHEGGPLLILAGAGTGKTTTLCSRVAWLIATGVPAERILLLTFTRRAAREMVGRARALTERTSPNAGRIAGGTFHSLAHRIVRLHAGSVGLGPNFGVLDGADAVDLVDLVRQEQGQAAGRRRFPRAQTMLEIYSRTVNSQVPLADVLAESFPWCAEHQDALAETFRAYGARKRELGLLDLDDLLIYWRALAADEVIGRQLEETWDHVLVDEYQDVNGLQVEIVGNLRRERRELTVVGDDFQAIYGFRAASARHILDFPKRFPDARTMTLERNYRSTEPILAVANAVSEQDTDGFRKVLWTARDGGRPPELVMPRDEAEQASEVCDRVLGAREEGIDLRRQAVLFRTGHDSALLELELTRRRIPFVKYGGLRYLDAAHVKDLVALLRLTENPSDEMSWFRLLQLLDGVGPIRARRVLDGLRPDGGGPPELGRWAVAAEHVPEAVRGQADVVLGALARDREAGGEGRETAGVRAERLCAALAPLIGLRYADGAQRLVDLEQLVSAAQGAESLAEFVSELVLDPPASSSDLAGPPHLDEDYLVLSTVHSAKGLEWDAVHVIAVYDGNFPADMATGSREGIAEERRLLYVALTRARRQLVVYVPVRYHHRPGGIDDAYGLSKASRFLTDRVQGLFRVTRTTEPAIAVGPAGIGGGRRRIEVSVDALFG